MAERDLQGFIVPRADEHLGEYAPPSAERLAWLTGFTGSAGLAVVLADKAIVFTDGRYVLQLARETDGDVWERGHVTDDPPPAWIAKHAAGTRIGYDPRLIASAGLAHYGKAGLTMIPVEANLVDALWTDRPAPPAAPARPHPLAFAGVSSADKRAAVAKDLRDAREDAAVLSDPASIAWLLNIRGDDLPFTPVTLAFALVHADGRAALFADPAKFGEQTREWLGPDVTVEPVAEMDAALGSFGGKRVRVDPSGTPVWFADRLRAGGAEVTDGPDPCALPKALKNEIEQAGARAAHRRDAVAMCRFLHWLEGAAGRGETEMSAAARLLAFRREVTGFRGESFPAIVGAGEHGAVIHYRATEATDRRIGANEIVLIDSGGQYDDGTTDVTRTIWTGPGPAPDEVRARATAVLRGHIAIASVAFPKGVAGPHLDALARVALWRDGLDYDHGTGHGVGSFLSVHEGPAGLARTARMTPLAPGMILSDEPGFYAPGEYGIRLENLLLVQEAECPNAKKPFFRFETLTLAPFDRRLIDLAAMTADEVAWLDAYHARVLEEVGPSVEAVAKAWLIIACRPVVQS